jgi:aspartyl-tRNA synthetase
LASLRYTIAINKPFHPINTGALLSNEYRSHYISELSAQLAGKEVRLAGWIHEVRDIGNIVFLLLRDHSGIIQVTAKKDSTDDAVMKSMLLPKESVVSVLGTVVESKQSKKGIEIKPNSIRNLNPLNATIPFEVTGKVPADLDVRLNYRYVDLRRLHTTAIFNIESTILGSFRSILSKDGFTEIRTPSLVKEATEGGADVFKVDYFGDAAYLAQSPQLYKQLAVIGGFDRVFMVVPIFRAEKHNTTFHLNEITQMDIEMGFADHKDAIKVLKKVVLGIKKSVFKNNSADAETLGIKDSEGRIVEVTYKKAIEKLNSNGRRIEFGEDFTREDEAALSRIFGDLIVLKEYPTMLRAFYTMPSSEDPEVSNSFDFIYKGTEICSGAQRIHEPHVLVDAIKKRGSDPKSFEFYINAFKDGAPPHAGWSIGLERFAMKMTGMENIREVSMFPRDRTRLTP